MIIRNRFIILTVAILAVMVSTLFLTVPAKAGQSGEWEGLSWTLSDAGCLTISGSETRRAIPDFSDNENNWLWKVLDQTLIRTVVIENGVRYIGDAAFINCSNLTSITIPDSVTEIGEGVFKGCSSLTGVTIPAGQPYICSRTFFGCSSLASITIPDSVKSIGQSAFYGCSSLTSITLPAGVTYIGDSAFQDCYNLSSINIPAGVTAIRSSTFFACDSLTSILLPENVTSIGDSAFRHCENLTSINIPNGVTTIPWCAFMDCKSLTGITIPNGVTTIGQHAFENCESLTDLTIPESVTTINNKDAFSGVPGVSVYCGSYADTYFAGQNLQAHRIHDWAPPTYIWADDNSTVSASATCRKDASHTASETVQTSRKVIIASTCEEGGISNFTATFEHEAFEEQKKENIETPALGHDWSGVIYTWAEDNSTVYASVTCGHDASHTESETAETTISRIQSPEKTKAGFVSYYADFTKVMFADQVKSVVIPALNDMNVLYLPEELTAVEKEAFAGTDCEAVIIPDGCTAIGSGAFASCDKLRYIRIPASVTSIAGDAFDGCTDVIYDHEPE